MRFHTLGLLIRLAASLLVAPLALHAHQPARLPTLGFFGATTPSAQSPWTAVFVQRLRELGAPLAMSTRFCAG